MPRTEEDYPLTGLFHLRKIIAILCCLQLLGGSYGILQTIAWSRMIVTNTQTDGLVTGIIKTFDGDHPCTMCSQISEAKKQDKAPDPISDLLGKEGPVKHFLLSTNLPDYHECSRDIVMKAPLAPPQGAGIDAAQPVSPPPRLVA